jgi:hypothetical protein
LLSLALRPFSISSTSQLLITEPFDQFLKIAAKSFFGNKTPRVLKKSSTEATNMGKSAEAD